MSEKNPVGRPTVYDPKICKLLIEYFDRPLTEMEPKEVPSKDGIVTIMVKVPTEPPMIEGFLAKHKILKSNFYLWLKTHVDLSDAFDIARQMQINHMATNGMMGRLNSTMTKMILGNISDYKDSSEVDHKSSDGSMRPVYNFTKKEKDAK